MIVFPVVSSVNNIILKKYNLILTNRWTYPNMAKTKVDAGFLKQLKLSKKKKKVL